MNKNEIAFDTASKIASDFLAGIRPPHGRSLRHEVKIQVSKATGGVDHFTRRSAADFAQEIVRGERRPLIIRE